MWLETELWADFVFVLCCQVWRYAWLVVVRRPTLCFSAEGMLALTPLACSSAVQKVRRPENEARGPFPQGFSCRILFCVQKETNFSLGLLFNRSSTRAASFNSNRGHAKFPCCKIKVAFQSSVILLSRTRPQTLMCPAEVLPRAAFSCRFDRYTRVSSELRFPTPVRWRPLEKLLVALQLAASEILRRYGAARRSVCSEVSKWALLARHRLFGIAKLQPRPCMRAQGFSSKS